MRCAIEGCENPVTAVSTNRPLCNKHLHMTVEQLAEETTKSPVKKVPDNKALGKPDSK